MNKGSLLELLRRDEGKALSFMELVYIGAQVRKQNEPLFNNRCTTVILIYCNVKVASGMSYLELRQLIHRDLAARNVLVGDGCVAKIW